MLRSSGLLALLFTAPAAAYAHHETYTVNVDRGAEITHKIGGDLTFSLTGGGPWAIGINHASARQTNLIFVINPPYRFSNQLGIGEGYGETWRESAQKSPRIFPFLYRKQDALLADKELPHILWPAKDGEQEEGAKKLAELPRGTLKLEISNVKYYKNAEGVDTIQSMRVKATFDWSDR